MRMDISINVPWDLELAWALGPAGYPEFMTQAHAHASALARDEHFDHHRPKLPDDGGGTERERRLFESGTKARRLQRQGGADQ